MISDDSIAVYSILNNIVHAGHFLSFDCKVNVHADTPYDPRQPVRYFVQSPNNRGYPELCIIEFSLSATWIPINCSYLCNRRHSFRTAAPFLLLNVPKSIFVSMLQ